MFIFVGNLKNTTIMKEVTAKKFKEVTDSISHSAEVVFGNINYFDNEYNRFGRKENEKYYLIDSLADDTAKTNCIAFARFIANGKDHFSYGSSMEMVYDEWVKNNLK